MQDLLAEPATDLLTLLPREQTALREALLL
jgi:hypothetical protein